MNKLLAAMLVAFLCQLPAHADVAAPANPPEVWDLGPLFHTTADWDKERVALGGDIAKLKGLKGTLGKSPASLQAALDQISAVRRRLSRLQVYASVASDVDTRVAENQERRQLADKLGSDFDEATAFVRAEVVALGSKKVEAWTKSTPGLAKHHYALVSMLRLAPHTLSASEEALLAGASDPLSQPQAIYSIFANADMPWPKITIHGQEVTLDQESYVKYREDQDPAVRKQVFDAFWKTFKAFEHTFGAVYLANLKGTVFSAQVHKYPNSVSQALSNYNTPEAVYRTLVTEANAGLPALHRYFALRNKMLGLKDAGYSDINVPLAKPPRSYTVAEAESLTLDALKPLGEDYEKHLAAGFAGGWMHAVPQRGKRSGAYMNGAAYDVHPYLLMSFNNDYNSVSTLAHEWGHAMHTVYANHQPYETSDYAIFVAEIPSTANEMLLADYVVAHAQTKEEKIFALSQELEQLRGTFFRQAMFAEFELKAHEAVEKGEPLTGERLSAIYLDLLRRYHGDKEGVVKIDDLYGIEWAYIPHFYADFYVFQYSTCLAAASYFAEGIEKGDTAMRDRYFKMLSAGASDDPYQIVKAAGPDLASPEPYRALVRRMNSAVDQLEALLATK